MAIYRIVLVAAAVLLTASAASAQRQPSSCSEGAQMCKEGISRARKALTVNSASCDAAFAECMKSGVFTGPVTGVRVPVAKK